MPNWVFTAMSVSGKPEDLTKFVEKAKKPHTTYWKDYKTEEVKEEIDERVISFWNFKKPENEQLYFGASDYKPEGYENMSTEEKMAVSMLFKSDGWYDWNIRNWGTKWNACDAEMTEDNVASGSVSYMFNTAWSPAENAFQAMVEQHPELSFEFRCVEEQGWGVVFVGEGGEMSVEKEWDIPDSHEEWMAVDEECRACSWQDDPEDWYDDCPDKTARLAEAVKETEKEVERFEDISEMIV